ncbi:MAG: tetratricopeptide repeat protein [candidate division Zixibacteria bacterium]|nr:tetratricopeptide repeat protein [candidate division Zixibacteria bacterium]
MICNKCGADNENNDSGYCQFCLSQLTPLQPDGADISEPDAQTESTQQINATDSAIHSNQPGGNIAQITAKTNTPNQNDGVFGSSPQEDNQPIELDEDENSTDPMFEIKEVNFDESSIPGLISTDGQPDGSFKHEENPSVDNENTEESESTENELDLFQDDDIQIAMEHTDEGPAITLAEKTDFQIAPEILPQELPNDYNDEIDAPEIAELPVDELTISSEKSKSITRKIAVPTQDKRTPLSEDKPVPDTINDEFKPPEDASGQFQEPDFEEDIFSTPGISLIDTDDQKFESNNKTNDKYLPDTTERRQPFKSQGIAYLTGDKVKFAGGYKPRIGDTISVDDRAFTLKEKPGGIKLPNYAKYGGGAVLLLVIIMALFSIGPSGKGQITGVLTDPITNETISGAIIAIQETGKTAQTNLAGFFVFDELPPRVYNVEYQDDGVGVVSEKLTVLEDRTSTVSLSLPVDQSSADLSLNIDRGKSVQTEKPRVLKPGFMKLKLSPSKSKVYYDGKYIGKGTQTFKVAGGKHKVTAKHNGYKSQTKSVNIPEDQIKSYSIALKKLSSTDKPEKKTDLEAARDLEDLGKYSEGLKKYNKILAKNESNLEAILGQARCLRAKGDTDESLTAFLSAVTIAGDQGDTDSQLKALNGILEINPNYLTALYKRGSIFLSQGEYFRAAKDFSQVIDIDRRHLNAFYKLGESYYKAGNYPAAIETYKGIQELNFADAKPYAFIAKSYHKLGDKKNMKKYYQKFDKNADMTTKNNYRADPEWQQIRMIAE